ncbi:hypothetical protein [Phaeovulum sp.]|uniref:hypothetical protein n=1 Tax=Phaeovulum sp. TaxID=2934796 RepID=UPI0035687AC3
MKVTPILISAAFVFGGHAPASAQALFDETEVFAACAEGAPACTTHINGVIAEFQSLGLAPTAFEVQLASLAAATLNVARANPTAGATVPAAMQSIAAASSDAGQKAKILAAANMAAQGGTAAISPTETVSASDA